MQSLKGHFLIAAPAMIDPNFARTVVLLLHHNEEGAFGVVLNRLTSQTVDDLWQTIAQKPSPIKRPVNIGGPVPGPLIAVHVDRELGEMEVIPGVFFTIERNRLQKLMEKGSPQLRLFVNHSGWAGGQLEGEIARGDWLTMPATAEEVFGEEIDMWHRLTDRIGREFVRSLPSVKELPDDVSRN